MIQLLSKTWNCGGRATQPYRPASPRMATVAYRLIPAANEKPIVRPAEARDAASRSMSGVRLQQIRHRGADARDQRIAVLDRKPRRFDRAAEPHRDPNGTDDQASLLHRVTRTGDRDRDDRRAPLQRHDEPALLEGQQVAGPAARPFRKDQKGVALAQRGRGPCDRRQALVAVAPLQGDKSREVERAHQDRQLAQLGLVENAQSRKQLAEHGVQDRRLDVAGMVDRVDRGTIAKDVLAVDDDNLDPAQPETKPDTAE